MPTEPHPPSGHGARAERLRALFDAALDQPVEQRAAWVAQHTGDPAERDTLERWLAADAGANPLDRSADERLQRMRVDDDAFAARMLGRPIGAFRLTRLLGEGGMAIVYLGEREDGGFRQQVAVKLLRRGLASPLERRLFERERQALASLSHPNITHLVDGGVSDDGVPYLILEYVRGMPITDHVASHGCSLRERLALFVVVCRAVAAAHRQLIVHRDLKPSNILVDDEGRVKLLDFGIAKLLADEHDDTRTELTALTPGYAAPEQVSGGAISTATDVYALGVILHELVLGQRPPVTASGRTRSLRDEVTPPDTARHEAAPRSAFAIDGDLGNVLRKALSAEPDKRYDSAAELADDVTRYLGGQPVLAHPPSGWYRARKFIGRHRGSALLTAAFVLAIVASLAIAVRQAELAQREAANARAESRRANTTRGFLQDLFEPISAQLAEGKTPSLRALVGEGVRKVEADVELDAAQRVDLLLMFSRLQEMLSEDVLAGDLAVRADALAREELPEESPLRTQSLYAVARTRLRRGEPEAARPLFAALASRIARGDVEPALEIDFHADMGNLEIETGHPQAALEHAQKELAKRRKVHGAGSVSEASGYNNIGYVLENLDRFDEAADAYRQALSIDESQRDADNLQRAFPLGNLAQALFNSGDLVEARQRFIEVLALHESVALEKPTKLLIGHLAMLVDTERVLGDPLAFEQALARLAYWAERSDDTMTSHSTLTRQRARAAFEAGDLAAAKQEASRLDGVIALMAEGYRRAAGASRDLLLAEIALIEKRDADALAFAEASITGYEGYVYPPYLRAYAMSVRALTCVAVKGVDDAGCRTHAQRAVEAASKVPYPEHPAMLGAHAALARVSLARGDAAAAVARLRTAIDGARARSIAPMQSRLAEAQAWLAVALAMQRDCAASREALARVGVRRDHPLVHTAVDEAAAECGSR